MKILKIFPFTRANRLSSKSPRKGFMTTHTRQYEDVVIPAGTPMKKVVGKRGQELRDRMSKFVSEDMRHQDYEVFVVGKGEYVMLGAGDYKPWNWASYCFELVKRQLLKLAGG